MVIGRAVAKRYIVQRLAQRYKPGITKYITQEYGQIAGSIAGVAISVGAGDYYGAITGITGKFGNNPPDDRAPPFGYFDQGGGMNGKANGSFSQTLRPIQYPNNRRRRGSRSNYCKCRKYRRSKYRKRSRGRKQYKGYLR